MLYRSAWKIPWWGSGHGAWYSNRMFIEDLVRSKNEEYGEGTHWVETIEKLEDEKLPGAIKKLTP